jgi:hypothetical protein
MTELATAIKALERMRDAEGYLTLDRDQANYLIFLLWDVHESAPKDLRFAALDLLGSLDQEHEEAI